MHWWIVPVVILTVIAFLEILGRIPAKYRHLTTPRLKGMLEILYVRGMDQAQLKVEIRPAHVVLHVSKLVIERDHVVLRLAVPPHAFDALDSAAVEAAMRSFGAIPVRTPHCRELAFDCGQSTRRALLVTEWTLDTAFKVDRQRDCVAWITGADRNPKAHPGWSDRPVLDG